MVNNHDYQMMTTNNGNKRTRSSTKIFTKNLVLLTPMTNVELMLKHLTSAGQHQFLQGVDMRL